MCCFLCELVARKFYNVQTIGLCNIVKSAKDLLYAETQKTAHFSPYIAHVKNSAYPHGYSNTKTTSQND